MPQVGEDSQSPASVIHDEGHAVGTVVRGGNRFDRNLAEPEGLAAAEVAQRGDLAQPITGGRLISIDRDVDGQGELAVQDAHRAAVVHVVVRDDDRIDAPDVAAVEGQAPLGLEAADAGVQQQLHPLGLDVDAIAVAARLEGDDLHGGIVSRRWPRRNG